MYKEIIESIKPELEKVVVFVQQKVSSLRTGRANPAIIENVLVDCFGSKMPLKQLGAISILDARKLRIQPWDKTYIEPIEKAILKETSGLSPLVDSEGLIINLPDISEDLRKEMTKTVGQIDDNAKKTIRKWRDDAWGKIQEQTREGLIREDDKFRAKDELQKVIDSYNEKIDQMVNNKKEELKG